ncbi:MAG: outer membrane receptor protein involved in Fe transport [Planctomycetota bacterium]|jgi:outer membrane receptor protein involved in Fe transport
MRYCFVVLLLACVTAAGAVDISGFVRDRADGESLPFASVYLKGENHGGISNESGYYAIAGVPPGRYELVVSIVGYAPFSKDVEVADEDLVLDVRLGEQAIAVEATLVEAEREKVENYDISPGRTTLQVRELKAAPAAIEADPIRTIQTLPGVAALSDFSVGLYVRGGTPDQNLILLDGTDVYNASHLFGLFSTFPADAAKSTELLRGGYPAKYGGRLSSVLNVITDEGNKEEFEGTGGLSLMASRLTLQGPVAKGSWLVSARRTHLDPLLAVAKDALDAKALGYNFYDLQGKMHQILSHRDQLTLAAYMGQDDLLYRFDELGFGLKWGNRTISSKWTHLFDNNLFGNLLFTGSRFKAETNFDSEDVELLEFNRLTDLSVKGDLSYFASEHHTVEVGFNVKRQSVQYEFGEKERNWFNIDVEAYHSAIYAQDNWVITPLLTLQPGLRFNHFDNGDYTGWSPRLAVRYQLDDDTHLKAAVGRYHQYIFRLAREFQGISLLSNIWALADSTADPSQSTHYIAGIETRIIGLDLDVEGYYKDYDGLYELNYDEQDSDKIGDILRRGIGRAYGLDVLLRKRSGRHTGWLSVSTGLSERKIDNLNEDENDRAQFFNSKFDRGVTIDLIHSWAFRKKWTLNSRIGYASGQPYTQVLGRGEVELPSGYRWTFNEIGPLNGVRLPSYQRIDLALQRQFVFRSWDMKAYLQIINVLNHKNVFNYFWDLEGDPAKRKPAKRRDIQMLPLLPSFGIDFNF